MNKVKANPLSFAFSFFCALGFLLASCASANTAAEHAIAKESASAKAGAQEDSVAESRKPAEGFDAYAFAQGILALLDAGDSAGVIAAFDGLEEPEASDVDILKLKLSILISLGDMKAAASLASDLEARLGEDVDVLYARAVIALAQNKPREREGYLRQIVKIDPGNTDALISLGEDSLMKRAYGDAARWFAQVLSADSKNASAHRGLVHSYYLLGRMKDARAAADRALALFPDDASLIVESALVHEVEKKLPEALNEMSRAVALAPDVASYWCTYGIMLMRASRLEDAREALSSAIRIDPSNAMPYLYRCGVNDTLGFIDEAIADYRVVCKSYPQYYFAAEGLGALLWIKGDFKGAKSAFAEALKYDSDNLSYALMYTLCSYKLGQRDEAKNFIGKFMNTLKDRTSVEYFLCRLFFDRSGDADVASRVSRLNDAGRKYQLMFYVAAYYEIFQSEALANKFYLEIASVEEPSCFEHKLAAAAIGKASAKGGVSMSSEGAR